MEKILVTLRLPISIILCSFATRGGVAAYMGIIQGRALCTGLGILSAIGSLYIILALWARKWPFQ